MPRYQGVMEMTFPHQALRQDSVSGRIGHTTILSMVAARQARSQTVRVLRRAETASARQGSADVDRIHYFAHYDDGKTPACGAFWQFSGKANKCETSVYQAGLVNIKHDDLDDDATGEQLTHAGHGAMRTL